MNPDPTSLGLKQGVARKRLRMDGHLTSKKATLAALISYLTETLKVQEHPQFLGWTEVHNGCCQLNWPGSPKFIQDTEPSREDLRRFFPGLKRELKHRFNATAVKVNRNIRYRKAKAEHGLKHGEAPTRDDEGRNDAFYRSCQPSSREPAIGIVVMPATGPKDHPLLKVTAMRRVESAATGNTNAHQDLDWMNGHGLISDRTRAKIRSKAVKALELVVMDMPLFPKGIES